MLGMHQGVLDVVAKRHTKLQLSLVRIQYLSESTGFNICQSRQAGLSLKPKTKIIFEPLIDKTPSDTSTILTAMFEAERITNAAGQSVTIFTADQQLYRVALRYYLVRS